MAQDKPTPNMEKGRRVGRYEVLTRLSIGGMAELFLAFLPGPGGFKKFVALKQILPDVRRDDSFVKMFLDEARITAAFNHANIAHVFDLGEDPSAGELFLAMEFVAGQNLEQVVKRSAKRQVPLAIGFSCKVVRDACLGLHYAHHYTDPASGQPLAVVHRDVSPKNVMVTYRGDVKMIDFGIAKAKGRLNRTQVGIVRGTSGYMAPEQVKNEQLDGRADLFAAGVMLYELLSGERLFTGVSDAAMMLKIVEGDVPPLVSVNPDVGQALSDVVAKALSKQREQRFATGKQLAKAIELAAPELFEEEEVAQVMETLFDDKIALTRSVFEIANRDQVAADAREFTQAAQVLTSEDQDGAPRQRPTTLPAAKRVATPADIKPPAKSAPLPNPQPRRASESAVRAAVPPIKTSDSGLRSTGQSPRRSTESGLRISAASLPKPAPDLKPAADSEWEDSATVTVSPSHESMKAIASAPRRVPSAAHNADEPVTDERLVSEHAAAERAVSQANTVESRVRPSRPGKTLDTDPGESTQAAPVSSKSMLIAVAVATVLALIMSMTWAMVFGPLKKSPESTEQDPAAAQPRKVEPQPNEPAR